MRFHLALQFLPLDEAVALGTAADRFGYHGVYLSDHLFNPKELSSRYTYSHAPDGSPFWAKETEWPDPMCLVSGLATATTTITFTTGVYIAPVRDLITVARTVGTAAALSHDRVHLGVGVGWCEEEYVQTGQDFHNRGKRLDDMIPALRALWQGGWVEYHGTYYDVPLCQMNPGPRRPVPILGGGDSPPALRRATTLCDGWLNTGAAPADVAFAQVKTVLEALEAAGRRGDDFAIYVALAEMPDLDLYRRLEQAGVTDLLCAPWFAVQPEAGAPESSVREQRIEVCGQFAERYVAAMV
jgi:probable F420-dependent oxidoreductase